MKVTIAVDSFKGSLTSLEAGQAVADGIKRVYPDCEICIRPLADGGEGTVQALTCGMGGELKSVTVTGPLGAPLECSYGIIREKKTAVIEMASAAGITLLKEEERNPLFTTSYGVGEMIKDAVYEGCRRFVIGIGGSATNDGGVGMLQALGFDMLDENGAQVPRGAIGLERLVEIRDEHVIPELRECSFRIACDVTNPLCGEDGCSAVFGPQKGADPAMVMRMDEWLRHYAALAGEKYMQANPYQPGAGAAGGLGFAFLTFTNASLESGVQIVLEETSLEEYVKDADWVITGEGRLDGQTVMGKAPVGVAAAAKKYGRKVLAFSGCVARDAVWCNAKGIDAFFPVLRSVEPLEEVMRPENARQNLIDTCEQVFRLVRTMEF
ncbi:glycerate kinase [Blautia schinkii]|nr:glycerate kinase [Blautia schinkii]